ncbi:hypothetical protein VTN00DRAFT_3653 [Thermoascus crustaceus]|uniref:uncharacterized protein n=1 Tax=Thermoascus crustaceus TaxID=5088 RepID=UPI0037426016
MAEPTGAAQEDVAPRVEIEVDTQFSESDSAYGDELSSYTASLTSSVLNFRNENGRSYHAYRDGTYLFPNDEEEKDRLDLIPDSPGLLADMITYLVVLGIDLSPIQPSQVPPNLKFLIDDFEDEWIEDDKFDFIHARYLAGSVKDFPKLLRKAYEHTAPGGWVEFQDWDAAMYSHDGSIKGTSIEQFYREVVGSFTRAGYIVSPGPKLEGWFRDAGFVDVHVQKYQVPMGTWPKDKHLKRLGAWNYLSGESGFEATALAVLTRHEKWTKDEVSILVAKTKNDAINPNIHAVFDYYVVYGRKPE